MNSSASRAKSNAADAVAAKHPYYDWLSANFPLLSGENFQLKYAENLMDEVLASPNNPLPENEDIVVSISVDQNTSTYKQLEKLVVNEFEQLCLAAEQHDKFGSECRQFLSFLILSNGYPLFEGFWHYAVEEGLAVLLELTKLEEFWPDLYSSVSGIIAYSQNTRVEVRLLMLNAYSDFLSTSWKFKPGHRETATVIFDALQVEFRRGKAEQNVEFQNKLMQLLLRYPHPAAPAFLSVLAKEHLDEDLRKRCGDCLEQMEKSNSFARLWETTKIDQVSSLEFRAQSLNEIRSPNMSELETALLVQAIFSACKGWPITNLSDARLVPMHALLAKQKDLLSLAAAYALSEIYKIDPACEIASEAISLLADAAVNGTKDHYSEDALRATKTFESMSEVCAQKVENAFIAANQKLILRNARDKSD